MSPGAVELPFPDYTVHPVGQCHTGQAGDHQLRLLEFYGLRRDSDLLDIGCGIGRLAYPLAGWLHGGSYAGFDIAPAPIDWLNAHYAPLLPNFRFDLVDVHNARYRPQALRSAASVAFPYDDDTFDMACSFSVFTHMRMPDIEHHLSEVARVVRPGGRALLTCYRLSDLDEDVPIKGFGPFVPVDDGAWSASPDLPERAIGYPHVDFVEAIDRAGLLVVSDVEGRWHGRDPVSDGPGLYQDFFVVRPR